MELSGRPLSGSRRDRQLFVDRTTELTLLAEAVSAGANTLVIGQPGSGKTSFVRQFEARSEGDFRVHYLDGRRFQSAAELLRELLGEVGAVEPSPAPSTPALVDALVRTVGSQTSERPCVVVDAPSLDIAHHLFGQLRDELWEVSAVWVVIGDVREREALLEPPADAFFSRQITLRPLANPDAFDLVRRRIDAGDASDDDVKAIIGLARGNPRELVSLAFSAFVDHADIAQLGARRAALLDRAAQLGPTALRLVEELDANGPRSASDATLLSQTGLSRGRLAQLFLQLKDAGIVDATPQRGRTGRPRMLYSLYIEGTDGVD